MSFKAIQSKRKIQPQIVELDQAIHAAGLVVNTSMKNVFRDIRKIYKKYMSLKEKNNNYDLKIPWEYISISTHFCDNQTWDYYTGHVVNSVNNLPVEFTSFEAPVGTYAVFPIRTNYKFLLGFAIGKMKKYIYQTWLPDSDYEFCGYEFEYNNKSMHQTNPNHIDLYVAVKKKSV